MRLRRSMQMETQATECIADEEIRRPPLEYAISMSPALCSYLLLFNDLRYRGASSLMLGSGSSMHGVWVLWSRPSSDAERLLHRRSLQRLHTPVYMKRNRAQCQIGRRWHHVDPFNALGIKWNDRYLRV